MVRSLGCVRSSQPEPTSIRTMTASPLGAAVDDLGKRLQGASLSGRPTAVLRATPRPRLLHHAQGRQPLVREQSEQRRSRLGNIAAGYLAAIVVADVILVGSLGLFRALEGQPPNDIVGAVLVGITVAVPTTIVLTLVPAAVTISLAERHRLRSW